MQDRNLLMLCDGPQHQTGFARVANNLGKRWRPFFNRIDVWALMYNGWPHHVDWVSDMYPGGGGEDWNTTMKLQQFLNCFMNRERQFTHIWILQDHFMLCHSDFPKSLREGAAHIGAKTFMYVPIDAELERPWMDIVNSVNMAVAYTEYGRDQIIKAMDGTSVMGPHPYQIATMPVIAHGSDPKIYRPLEESKKDVRARVWRDWAKDDDFVMLCVSANQRRKGHYHVLQMLSEMKKRGAQRVKLVMHMPAANELEGNDLRLVGRQMGLVEGIDWISSDDAFRRGHALLGEHALNDYYNAADLLVTGTLGEGWGLTITEAMLAGLPVAAPAHTAIWEIFDNARRLGVPEDRIVKLPLATNAVCNMLDNSRVRFGMDVVGSAEAVIERINQVRSTEPAPRTAPPAEFIEWLNWNRIAKQWLKLFGISDDEILDRYSDL